MRTQSRPGFIGAAWPLYFCLALIERGTVCMISLPATVIGGDAVNEHFKKDLAHAFVTTQSFKSHPSGFKLASGAVSPYYVDCRVLMAHPGPRRLVARLAAELLYPLSIACIGGLEIGAIAIATAISDQGFMHTPRQEWRTFVVRKQPKDHGLGKSIEGAFRPGDRALVVDDVLTSGGSVIKAIAAARDAGMQVDHALVIVDREEQHGRARVEEQGVKLLSLLTIRDLLAVQVQPDR